MSKSVVLFCVFALDELIFCMMNDGHYDTSYVFSNDGNNLRYYSVSNFVMNGDDTR